jgi:MtN3 and saliva related transmembrane protein
MEIVVIGTAAAIASMASFAPQAWRIIKTRKTDELSLAMWVTSVIGFGLWTTYGVLLGQWPLIVENAVCVVLAGFILMMKLLPTRHVHAVADALDPAAHDR